VSRKILSLVAVLFAMSAAAVVGAGESDSAAASIVDPVTVVGPPAGTPLSGEELDRRTHELASTMRCPVCQALSVADSPTASALAMKEEVRDLLAAGFTDEQVLEYFEKSYGEFILLAPKRTGLNWLVWIAPFFVILIGFLIIVSRRGGRSSTGASSDEATDLSIYADRVRQEIAE
jgi:cytochrome c-type biogenesis protein CcmH/NrfF